MSRAYYNENDPKAAAWLRELILDGLIAPGDVDERSIKDVIASDLHGYSQHHFFAGIGGWSYALRLAGWPDDRAVATGSCPCQPFSVSGKQLGRDDPRHLWPAFRRIINQSAFAVVFGEQVASKDGREWLAGVCPDLETMGYAAAGADLCAAGAAAPHLRQRLYWVAYANSERRAGEHTLLRREDRRRGRANPILETARSGEALRVAYTNGGDASAEGLQRGGVNRLGPTDSLDHVRLGDDDDARPQGRRLGGDRRDEWAPWATSVGVSGSDGKTRRLEPAFFPLAARIPGRVGLIRGAGNAIVPQVAARFVQACEEAQLFI